MQQLVVGKTFRFLPKDTDLIRSAVSFQDSGSIPVVAASIAAIPQYSLSVRAEVLIGG
jgi:hypothetical protein